MSSTFDHPPPHQAKPAQGCPWSLTHGLVGSTSSSLLTSCHRTSPHQDEAAMAISVSEGLCSDGRPCHSVEVVLLLIKVIHSNAQCPSSTSKIFSSTTGGLADLPKHAAIAAATGLGSNKSRPCSSLSAASARSTWLGILLNPKCWLKRLCAEVYGPQDMGEADRKLCRLLL